MTKEQLEAIALGIQIDYLASMPYLTVVEAYFERYGEDPTDDDGYVIHDLIMSGEL